MSILEYFDHLYFVFQVTGLFQFVFRLAAEVEARFTSVERLNYYVKILKPEGKFTTEDKKLVTNWPSDGSIVFNNVSVSKLLNIIYITRDFCKFNLTITFSVRIKLFV